MNYTCFFLLQISQKHTLLIHHSLRLVVFVKHVVSRGITCLELFHEMHEVLLLFLDATISPLEHLELLSGEILNWNWDRETKTRAQRLKASLSLFQTIAVFIIIKNVLVEVKVFFKVTEA